MDSNLPIVIVWIIYIAWSVIQGGMQGVSKETRDIVRYLKSEETTTL